MQKKKKKSPAIIEGHEGHTDDLFLPFLLSRAEKRIHGATTLTFNLRPEKVRRTKQNKTKKRGSGV